MALQGQPVDVPLMPMNQQATATGGPIGRLRLMINAVAKKITRTDAGTRLRVEKRDGFAALPTAVRDPSSGAVSSKTLVNPQLVTTFRNQLLAVFAAQPFVLSEDTGSWESPTYACPANVLREQKVYSGNGVLTTVDSSRIGTRTMYIWVDKSLGIVFSTLLDDDGTVVRQTISTIAASNTISAKVANDGVRFWIVSRNFSGTDTLNATAIDVNGATLGTLSVASAANSYFDAITDASLANGVYAVQRNPISQATLIRFTWNGAAVVQSGAALAFIPCSTGRVAFLRNDTGDGNLYIAAIDGAGPFATNVWQVTTPAGAPGNGHAYTVTASGEAFQITGFVAPSGPKDITVVLSNLDTTPAPQLNSTTIITVTFAGVTITVRQQRGMTAVSRPFVMDGNYYAVVYYASNPVNVFSQLRQSTYFLLALSAPWQTCGRWEWGGAYADWADTTTVAWYCSLSTPSVAPSGAIHVALPYRAHSSTASAAVNITGGALISGSSLVFDNVDSIGLKDWSFGPDYGQAVEYAGEILLPGPQAVCFTGSRISEDGIPLVPEVSSMTQSHTGTGIALQSTVQYIFVAEWTDDNGNRVRGPAGAPVTITLTGTNDTVTATGYMIHGTAKTNVAIMAYRTVTISGVQSTLHYKVTGTITSFTSAPAVFVYNDDNTATWTLVDNSLDVVARQQEVLYTDKTLLDRHPAPPFSTGTAAFNRVFVVAPDNSIWFSGEKTEGDALWFSPAQRITLPTFEKIKAIRQLDNFLIVLCEKSAVFSIPAGPFPDATGQGTIPSPVLLPFTNGCTGFAEVTDDGVMYSSVQGGIWMITRALLDVYIGAPVEDDTASGIVGSDSDDKQRVMFVSATGNMVVYDSVTSCWSTWVSSAFDIIGPAPVAVHKGRFVLMTGIPSIPVRQQLGLYTDVGVAIPTTAWVDFIHFGGVRGYVRVWDAQIEGVYYGDHDLLVQAYVDDNATAPVEVYQFTPTAGQPYIYKLPPKYELCTSRSYKFMDSFPRGPSQGFALETISFFVGVEKGLARLPAATSVKPT